MISIEEIKKISELARIELKKGEAEIFQKDLAAVLDYVSKLKEVPLLEFKKFEKEEKSQALNIFRRDEPLKDESGIKKEEFVKVKHVL